MTTNSEDHTGMNIVKHCIYCKHFKLDIRPTGKMPGVRDNYRECIGQRFSNRTRKEWRAPTDSCQLFDAIVRKPVMATFKTKRAK